MERMRENVSKAKSCKMIMVTEVKVPGKPGQPPISMSMSGDVYWLAPTSIRMELNPGEHSKLDQVEIFPAGKEGLAIDRAKKTYRRVPARRGHMSPLMYFEGLGKFSGQADRELGSKTIDGRKVQGFLIDTKKIDPDAYSAKLELWLDAETSLPAEMRIEMNNANPPMSLLIKDFKWNSELDPKLFDTTPPEGYADATPKPPSPSEQVERIAGALKLYAELSGGHYPRGKMVYGDVTKDEMLKLAGIGNPPTEDNLRSKNYEKILNATLGLATLAVILRDNADAAYYGRTVGPNDKDKVLLRWKLDDGQYHVVYGDLRGETITGERLKTLESK
jgi:outer membrane lipoprotein-sorting protein